MQTPGKQVVPTVPTDKCVVMHKEYQLHLVKTPLQYARATGNMPSMDNARLVLPAKLPTPRKQVAPTVPTDKCAATQKEHKLQPVLAPRLLAKANRSMPSMDDARLAPLVKLATPPNLVVFKNNSHDLHEATMTKLVLP